VNPSRVALRGSSTHPPLPHSTDAPAHLCHSAPLQGRPSHCARCSEPGARRSGPGEPRERFVTAWLTVSEVVTESGQCATNDRRVCVEV
jgi:hypothetical protein